MKGEIMETVTQSRAQVHIDRRMDRVSASEHSRYAMSGLQVFPAGDSVFVGATDGHIAAVSLCAGSSDAKHIIPRECFPARSRQSGYDYSLGDEWDNGKARAADVAGTFPRMRDVIPEAEKGQRAVSLDAGLLQKLADAISDCGVVTLVLPENPSKPILVVNGSATANKWASDDDAIDAIGVIMPVKIGEGELDIDAINAFRDRYAKAEQAAQ
jgi:hypothetical protein